MEKTVIFNEKRIKLTDFLIGESRIKKYVLDASVVSKWYYKKNEADLHSADVLYNFLNSKQHLLFAPQSLIYEILNAFRLKEEIKSERNGFITFCALSEAKGMGIKMKQ